MPQFLEQQGLPDELGKYASFGMMKRNCVRLTIDDLQFVCRIATKHPVSFFFQLKCMWMIAAYSYAIYRFEPKVIIASAEYSFTSSILTLYCEQQGINHCDVMHGEKILSISDSFFRFSKMYVWDLHYMRLFKTLNAMQLDSDYIVYRRMKSNINAKQNGKIVKYYLQIQTKEQLQRIRESLGKLGREYKVRPHPIYKSKWIYSVFDNAHIEDPTAVPIEASLNEAALAVAEDSTVLQQAYCHGIPIVIDDITNPRYFCELYKRQYIMMQKNNKTLSQIIGNHILKDNYTMRS